MSRHSLVTAGLLGVLLSGCAAVNPPGPASGAGHWVASWGTASIVPDEKNELPAAQWRDASLRQVVRVSVAGNSVRVQLTNVHGTAPLTVDAASVALSAGPGRSDVVAGSLRPLRFGGKTSVTIPAGAEYVSDPVDLGVTPGADLAVTMHFPAEPARQTSHPGSRATSFVAKGNLVNEAAWPQAEKVTRWYQLAGIDVNAQPAAHAVVAIGDSITDGYGVQPDTNARWTDALALRLRASGMNEVGVVNAGIGGGRMLRDGIGPNLAARFNRDVLERAGVTHAIVMIGVNDFGVEHRNKQDNPAQRQALLDDLKESYRQLVARAHARGVCVIGGTIGPYAASDYYKPGPDNEADRQAYNRWIRESGTFDGVADFDAVLRDPARPDYLLKAYDNDGLHPSIEGYRKMAEAVPLDALKSCRHAAR
nr:GDSL-like Lipase/Acylhydrolase family [uncultured organism]